MQVSIYKPEQRSMRNMKRALMFTTYELIICVTPRAAVGELALSGRKNRRSLRARSHGVQTGFTVQNPMQRNFLFFP